MILTLEYWWDIYNELIKCVKVATNVDNGVNFEVKSNTLDPAYTMAQTKIQISIHCLVTNNPKIVKRPIFWE